MIITYRELVFKDWEYNWCLITTQIRMGMQSQKSNLLRLQNWKSESLQIMFMYFLKPKVRNKLCKFTFILFE